MQESIARSLIAAGADIVVGSHAHQQQGAGMLGKAFVDYGLGNFVWYSQGSVASTTTGVLEVTVTGRRIDRYSWIPATIVNGSPTPRTGSARSGRDLELAQLAQLHEPQALTGAQAAG